MKILVILFLIVMNTSANARYVIYNKITGQVLCYKSDPACLDGQAALKIVSDKDDFSKKVVNGEIVDDVEAGKYIELTGDTEATAGAIQPITYTIRLSDRYGSTIINADRDIIISTTRGKLSKKKIKTKDGMATFTLKVVDETITIDISAVDSDNIFASAKFKIELNP